MVCPLAICRINRSSLTPCFASPGDPLVYGIVTPNFSPDFGVKRLQNIELYVDAQLKVLMSKNNTVVYHQIGNTCLRSAPALYETRPILFVKTSNSD
jgi:hypothetical protein